MWCSYQMVLEPWASTMVKRPRRALNFFLGLRSVMDGDMERIMLLEAVRSKAVAEHVRSPHNVDNLIQWGVALLELAHFREGPECLQMVQEAQEKLHEALKVNPRKHEALWFLGNAHTAHGFLFQDASSANKQFALAAQYFQQALMEDPTNENYLKSVEMSAKAPEVYIELQKQMRSQQLSGCGASGSGSGSSSRLSSKKSSDFVYDVLGWVMLAVGVVAWIGMSKAAPPRAI